MELSRNGQLFKFLKRWNENTRWYDSPPRDLCSLVWAIIGAVGKVVFTTLVASLFFFIMVVHPLMEWLVKGTIASDLALAGVGMWAVVLGAMIIFGMGKGMYELKQYCYRKEIFTVSQKERKESEAWKVTKQWFQDRLDRICTLIEWT